MNAAIDPVFAMSAAGHAMLSLIASRVLSIEHLEVSAMGRHVCFQWLSALPVLLNLQHLSWNMAACTLPKSSRLLCSLPPNLKSFHLAVRDTTWHQTDLLRLDYLAAKALGRAVTAGCDTPGKTPQGHSTPPAWPKAVQKYVPKSTVLQYLRACLQCKPRQNATWHRGGPAKFSGPVAPCVSDLRVQLSTSRATACLDSQGPGSSHSSRLDVSCCEIFGNLSASCLTHLHLTVCWGVAWDHYCGTITFLTDLSITIMDNPARDHGRLFLRDRGNPAFGARLLTSIKQLHIEVPVLDEVGIFKGLQPGVLQALSCRMRCSEASCFCLDNLKYMPGYKFSINPDESTEVSIRAVG